MRNASNNRRNYKPANNRTFALALLICFVSAFLISGAFILTHADHEHDNNGAGGSCTVCVQIQNAENVLRLFVASAVGFTLFQGCYAAVTFVRALYYNIPALTPITAKNRMNN